MMVTISPSFLRWKHSELNTLEVGVCCQQEIEMTTALCRCLIINILQASIISTVGTKV